MGKYNKISDSKSLLWHLFSFLEKKFWLILFLRPSLTVGVPIRLYTPCGRRVSKTFMLRHSPNIIIWRLCPLWHHTVTDMSKSETRRCSSLMQNSITVLLRTITLSLPVECQVPYASVHGHWLRVLSSLKTYLLCTVPCLIYLCMQYLVLCFTQGRHQLISVA